MSEQLLSQRVKETASDEQYTLGSEYSSVRSASPRNLSNNPGQTKSGIDRSQTFDETPANYIKNQAEMAKFSHINSPEGSILSWATAGANNRAIEPISNVAKILGTAIVNAANEVLYAEHGLNRGQTLLPKPSSIGQSEVKGFEPSESGDL